MAISDFGQLKAAIQLWAARSDLAFSNRLGDFVTLAEDRIYRGGEIPLPSPAIRTKELAQTADLTITDGAAPLPQRFLEAYRIYFDGQPAKKLRYMSPREFHTVGNAPQSNDEPVWYTIEGNTFLVQPGVGTGTGKLGFYQRFASLEAGGDSGTNPLLLEYPSLYLYSALVAAFSWARNSNMATENFSLYASVANGLSKSGTRADRSGQSLAPVLGVM